MGYFSNKVVWITGASSGIGLEMARQCAALGARVVLSARSVEKLEQIKSSLKNPDTHLVLPLDLEQSTEFPTVVKEVIAYFGKIDILVNNGGVSQRSEAALTPLEVDRRIMEINFFGNIALTKAVLPYFRKEKSGQFIVISSISGKFGFYLRSAYAASKHALHGFYDSLALEEAKYNINVTIAVPGKINTPISYAALNEKGEKHGVMDHNQASGMPVEQCVKQILNAAAVKKREVLIGGKETKAVTLKRFFPNLFWKVIAKQSAT